MGKPSKQKNKKIPKKQITSPSSIRHLCELYYLKDPERLSYLRLDLLGLLIQHSAVHSGSCNVFVYEQALGLVGAAFIERLAGQGSCIFLHKGDWPQSIPCIKTMNFDDEQLNAFLPLRISTFLRPDSAKQIIDAENGEGSAREESDSEQKERNGIEPAECEEGIPNKKPRLDRFDDEKAQRIKQKRLERAKKEQHALELMAPVGNEGTEGKLDAICLAGRTFDPLEILQKVYPGLRLAGNVVVYSPFKQHLLRIWQWLRSTGSAIGVQLHEQQFRVHQIDTNRTHPLMKQAVTGGYILHATKVLPPHPEQQQQRGLNRALLTSYNQREMT